MNILGMNVTNVDYILFLWKNEQKNELGHENLPEILPWQTLKLSRKYGFPSSFLMFSNFKKKYFFKMKKDEIV